MSLVNKINWKAVSIFLLTLATLSCSESQKGQVKTTTPDSAMPNNIQQPAGEVCRESETTIGVVEKVLPAVVSVHSEKIMEVQPHQYFNPFEDFFNFDPFGGRRGLRPPEKRQYKQQGLGSGVIVSKEGHVITNHHVAGEADNIKITLTDDREFEAEIVGSDKLSDVAILKIKNPPKNLPLVNIGDSDNLRVGETVIAMGNPFGYSNTVTKGIISAKGRSVGINSYENYIQTDASINPGNSGGALVNLKGQLIGINTAIASKTGASHGIGFAIPINMARNIMEDLMNMGHVTRGYLGVYLQELDKNLALALGLEKPSGAVISKVIEDSPAENAGVEEGDVILKINGKKMKDVNEVRNRVAQLEPEKKYRFTLLRGKKEKTLKVKIGKREQEETRNKNSSAKKGTYGLTLENIAGHHVQRYRLSKNSGVIVTQVSPGSEGEKAGFRPGDLVLEVEGKKISKTKEFKKSLKKKSGKTVLIKIDRQGQARFLGLKTN